MCVVAGDPLPLQWIYGKCNKENKENIIQIGIKHLKVLHKSEEKPRNLRSGSQVKCLHIVSYTETYSNMVIKLLNYIYKFIY